MLIGKIISTISIVLITAALYAQPPKGFVTGTVYLANGATSSGYIKDDIRQSASVQFLAENARKSVKYNGMDISGAEIGSQKFQCIKGDFFKIISEGELCFLQKASDASGKIFNNGNEVIAMSGTEGKPGDYFFYNTSRKQLSIISRKNFEQILTKHFGENSSAIEKAKSASGDMIQLKEAVDMYNHRN